MRTGAQSLQGLGKGEQIEKGNGVLTEVEVGFTDHRTCRSTHERVSALSPTHRFNYSLS